MKKATDPNTVEGKAVALAMSAVMAWSQAGYVPVALAEEANGSGYEASADGTEGGTSQQTEATGGDVTEPGQADQGAGTGETTEGDAGDEGGAEDSGAEQGDATEGEDETTEGGTEGEADGGATEGETTEGGAEGGTEGETTEGGATSQDASSTEGAANTLAATPSLSSPEDSIMLADVEGVHDVYVFAKLTGYDTAGNEATTDSWITIGKLTGVNITDPAEFGTGKSAAEDSIEWGIATQAIEDGSLVTVDGFDSTLFDPSDVTWIELKVVAGAPDFGISGDCWHLDGAVELGKVAVNYHLLTDGKQTDMKTDFSGVSVGTTMDFTTTAYANKFASEGYTLDATQGGDTSITVKSGDGNEVDLYYNKVTKSSGTVKYVTYDASGNEVELQNPSRSTTSP